MSIILYLFLLFAYSSLGNQLEVECEECLPSVESIQIGLHEDYLTSIGKLLLATRPTHAQHVDGSWLRNTKRGIVMRERGTLASIIRTPGNNVVSLRANAKSGAAVTRGATRAELVEYLENGEQIVSALPMPPGARCTRKPGASSKEFVFTMPKMQLFDVSLQPTSDTVVMNDDSGALLLTSDRAALSGSHHVQSLGLNDRYSCNMEVRIAPSTSGGRLEGSAKLSVDVDLPPPFSLLPKGPQAATGSAVLQASTQFLLDDLMPKIVADFARWRAQNKL